MIRVCRSCVNRRRSANRQYSTYTYYDIATNNNHLNNYNPHIILKWSFDIITFANLRHITKTVIRKRDTKFHWNVPKSFGVGKESLTSPYQQEINPKANEAWSKRTSKIKKLECQRSSKASKPTQIWVAVIIRNEHSRRVPRNMNNELLSKFLRYHHGTSTLLAE